MLYYSYFLKKTSNFGQPYNNPVKIRKDISNFIIVQMIQIQFEMLQIFYDTDTLRYRLDTKKSQILYKMIQIHCKKGYGFGQSKVHRDTD